jgi:hypothetical protein
MVATVAVILKFFEIRRAGQNVPPARLKVFLLSPLLTINSVLRLKPVTPTLIRDLLKSAILTFVLSVISFRLYWWIVKEAHVSFWIYYYLAIPVVFLIGNLYGSLSQIALSPSGFVIPPQHNRLFSCRSLAEFWGNGWNIWVGDWLREHIFMRLRRHPRWALFATFLLSGLLHEVVINLPLYWVTGRALFGTMILFFLAQALGIFFERKYLRAHPVAMRVLTWIVLVAPAPLVLNEAALRAFRLWPN